ncbi:MAG: Ig-like domain-containing protein [Bryobacterales bacterium]|nr:Ig-like domain-containing protein [Bryobacterales bacterium]
MLTVFRLFACASVLWTAAPLQAAGVRVQFDPSRPEVGPFPTDFLTAPATNTNTARRVRLPAPTDCNAQASACQDISFLNELDGFHRQARVRVKFSAAVNPETLKAGIFLIALNNYRATEPGVHKENDKVELNQFVWDSTTNTAYAKPDGPMDQHRRYLLLVTDAVKDTAGDAVEADPAYTTCTGSASDDYCRALAAAVPPLSSAKVVAASVFSTMSTTSWLERAREALAGTPAAPQPISGTPYLTSADVQSLVWRRQVRTTPSTFDDLEYPAAIFGLLRPAIKGIGFGEFTSPDYLGTTRVIPASPSADALAAPAGTQQIPYITFLPQAEKPASGYPVVIFGHGAGDSRFGAPSLLSIAFGQPGMATIAINAPGHGFGPGSTLRVGNGDGSIEIPAPGRGVDTNGDGLIGDSEGCAVILSAPQGTRDCLRQSAVDLMQLVRAIRAGIDVDGDGSIDLDPEKIYYVGQSLGSIYGTLFLATEPAVVSGAFNVGGGSVIDISRWSPSNQRALVANLALRRPALSTGATFDDGYPLRNQPVRVLSNATQIEIQNVIENLEWLQSEGDPVGYAPHLKLSPLPGLSPKNILVQFAEGDQTVPNPTSSALVRWSGLKENTWVYRHGFLRSQFQVGANPHTYLTDFSNFLSLFISQAVQGQIANFLASGTIPNPNGSLSAIFGGDIFVQPDVLPEDLNYLEP